MGLSMLKLAYIDSFIFALQCSLALGLPMLKFAFIGGAILCSLYSFSMGNLILNLACIYVPIVEGHVDD